jgi:DNA-binding transcriptional MerR regulator/methylmalonyl-CoA mutase cobalamin-binding subunit
MPEEGLVRIGELSRRAGVTPELLRAWERRYGLLRPTRSSGGLRLYGADDVERVRQMQQYLAEGFAAAEAAALAARGPGDEVDLPAFDPAAVRRDLGAALDAFDESEAQAIVDQLLAAASIDTALSTVVLPYLHELGDRWRRGEVSIAQEHFASSVLRGRMLGLARGWGRGLGPRALLACLPGERHDLGLLAFGLALRSRGWRIAYLGSDTPLETLAQTARVLEPSLVVLSTVSGHRVRSLVADLQELVKQHRLAVGGNGATAAGSAGLDAILLPEDPVAAAEQVTALAGADVARA